MITLGIETSCDETAVALVEDGRVLSSEVSSSVHLHARYGGVVPEIASRYHVEFIFPVLQKALSDARRTIDDVDRVAVTRGPGLPGSLLVGISFAKAISFARDIPLVGVNHLHAHILSCFLDGDGCNKVCDMFPFVGVVLSGGHTSIYVCSSLKDLVLIGRTKDDAVGEAFDKVAKMLGLGYPGGPVVEERAARYAGGDIIRFPRALLTDETDIDFSFSGIKTAVLYYWRDCAKTEDEINRICASFQEAVTDVIDKKVDRAMKHTAVKRLAAGGGVVSNGSLRRRLADRCREEGYELYLPSQKYCADNAAMVAALGECLFEMGEEADLFMTASSGEKG